MFSSCYVSGLRVFHKQKEAEMKSTDDVLLKCSPKLLLFETSKAESQLFYVTATCKAILDTILRPVPQFSSYASHRPNESNISVVH